MSDATTPPGAANAPTLRPQPHGGALLPGGQPGNRGGGRRKDALRARSRDLYAIICDQIEAKLAGAALAHDSVSAIVADPRILALPNDVQTIVQTVVRQHCTAQLSAGELQRCADTLGKYGIGTQQEIETTETRNYVVQLPERSQAARQLIAGSEVRPLVCATVQPARGVT